MMPPLTPAPASVRASVRASARGADLEVLTFNLARETFALEAILVREVLDKSPETQVPGAPAFVDAVINFRGRIIRWPISGSPSASPPKAPLSTAASSSSNSCSPAKRR